MPATFAEMEQKVRLLLPDMRARRAEIVLKSLQVTQLCLPLGMQIIGCSGTDQKMRQIANWANRQLPTKAS